MDWSRIVGVLAVVGQIINFALMYFANVIPPDVAVILAGVLGFISAVTGRVQVRRVPDWKDFFRIGKAVGKTVAPPAIGSILDAVEASIADRSDPANEVALRQLTLAVIDLQERVKRLEKK